MDDLRPSTTTKKRWKQQRLDPFAASILSEWRRLKLPVSDATMLVAVSGGADSTALLLGLHELISASKLSLSLFVAHLDHGLRKESRRDALWVSRLAEKLGYQAIVGRADIPQLALDSSDNLEQTARRARYDFFERSARRKKANCILVGHTMDDQAETVLLRLVRGSASEGLSGMAAIRPLKTGSNILVIRPLLSWARHSDSESFCRRQNIAFAVDEMNQDERFARVKVRRQLLPLMESINNRIVETLSRTASLLREDSSMLATEAANLLKAATDEAEQNVKTEHPVLNVNVLGQAPAALRRRALRMWLSGGRGHLLRVEHVHLLGVERLLGGDKGGRVAELPGGAAVRRSRGRLELIVKKG